METQENHQLLGTEVWAKCMATCAGATSARKGVSKTSAKGASGPEHNLTDASLSIHEEKAADMKDVAQFV